MLGTICHNELSMHSECARNATVQIDSEYIRAAIITRVGSRSARFTSALLQPLIYAVFIYLYLRIYILVIAY